MDRRCWGVLRFTSITTWFGWRSKLRPCWRSAINGTQQEHHDGTVLADFLWILEQAESELRNVFREEGTVDFQEITRAATLALGGPESPSDLLYSLDYRIEHILVDEFQDTSRAQHELLQALTGQWSDGDGRTLFLVGDPVQSIYGFRAAEVALFMQAWEDERLGAVRLDAFASSNEFPIYA